MVKVRNAFSTKVAALLLAILIFVSALPTGLVNIAASSEKSYGTLSSISPNGTVTNGETENAVVTFSGVTLEWVEANPLIGRTTDGWWVGAKMEAPADLRTEADFEGVTYSNKSAGEWGSAKIFWNFKDSPDTLADADDNHYIGLWAYVSEQYLNDAILSGKNLEYVWGFNWDKDDTTGYEQTASISINPAEITLIKDGEQVYPSTTGKGTVSTITEGLEVVTEADTNYVKVQYNKDVALDFIKKENSDQTNDGWWAGIKVTAPEDLKTKEDFEGVKYQTKSGGVWGTAKDFWNYKDSANDATDGHFIGLWGLINENYLKNATAPFKYIWRFDWNKDGVYEQIVILEIDPKYITLNDESGVQIYPELGSVSTITAGTVSGNKSGEVVVDISSEISLDWSPVDTSIGRYTEGWWAGILITAPEGLELTQTNDVNYQSKIGADDWSTNKSFFSNQDSPKDSATVNYMQLWTVLDRAMVKKAIADGEKITAQWRFDWDRKAENGFEQLVTFTIDPNKVTLNRLDRTDFAFDDTSENITIWVGDGSYKNEAGSLKTPGKVVYSIVKEETTAKGVTVDENGEVTFETTGKITVKATIEETDLYTESSATYTFEVVKKCPDELAFDIKEPKPVTYKEGLKFNNDARHTESSGNVSYSIIGQWDLEGNELEKGVAEISEISGQVTVLRSGVITVRVDIEEDDKYTTGFTTYTLTINKDTQDEVKFVDTTPSALTYSTTPFDVFAVEGIEAKNAEITYSVEQDGKVVELKGNTLTALTTGKFTLIAEVSGDDCYEPATISKEIEIVRADQTGFAFEYANPEAITYNDNGNVYVNTAKGGESTGEITYAVISDNEVAEILDPASPELTIKKSGEVTVKATKAGDDKYNETSATYTIFINKDDQTFTFEDGEYVTLVYGTTEYTNAIKDAGPGTGSFTYTIEKNDIGATVKNDTVNIGVSDGKVGEVVVTVTKAEDECYNSCTKTYTINVVYLDAPQDFYSIEEETNSNGWYDSAIHICAPAGYLVAYDNKLDTVFDNKVEYATNGETNPVIYLKSEADGFITDEIQLPTVKIDTKAPEVSLDYVLTVIEKIGEVLFGFSPETVDLCIEASDNGEGASGIDYIWYSLDGGVTYLEENKVKLENGKFTLPIDAQFRNRVEAKAYDMAGNVASCITNEVFVVDDVTPGIEAKYSYTGFYDSTSDEIAYTNGDVTAEITVNANNFDLNKKCVVTVNGTEEVVEWTTEGVLSTATVTLTETGYYTLKCEYEDYLGRTAVYEKKIHIDKENPVFSDFIIEPGVVINSVGDRKYYAENQTVTISVSDHNFDPANTILTVVADNTDVDTAKYTEDFKKIENWTETSENVWTTKIKFTTDANYSVYVVTTDKASNSTTSATYQFTVDKTAPAKPFAKIDKSVLTYVMETLTFGYYNAPVTVTVTSSDITAGIKSIGYSFVGTKGEYDKDVVSFEKIIDTDNNTIEFRLPEEGSNCKGVLTLTAYDYSGNASAVQTVVYDDGELALDGIVVDDIAPERTVIVPEADRVVNSETLIDVTDYDYTKENTNSILYYNDEATFTFVINEANFFAGDVVVKVNGNETALTKNWEYKDNKWYSELTLSDEGDYIITMEYTDKSENTMTPYRSEKIVIDKTAPVIKVAYDNNDISNTIKNREYYKATQTATITVKEHNFRADDFRIMVSAKDINGKDVLTVDKDGYVVAYAEDGTNRSLWSDYTADWRREDDTYKFIITYSADANYTFDAEYTDLATNADKAEIAKEFTVDTTDAYELNVEYNKNIIDNVLSGILFYNSKTNVTISAKDDVAGIEYFSIKVNTDGLSEATTLKMPEGLVVNADGTVKSGSKGFIGEIKSTQENGKVTLSFDVPAQFRGEFVIESVTDLSHNVSDKYDDDTIVVVDTITSDVKVEFTGSLKDKIDADVEGKAPTRQPKNTADANTRFVYDGEVTATITVKEANFYDDMIITVYRDGEAVTDCEISDWAQVDGTFEYVKTIKLSADGDYQIQLNYEDKSDNKMDVDASGEYADNKSDKIGTYTSNIHTVDTTVPVYTITYDKNNIIQTIDGRDYYDATRTATIKVTDRNFRPGEVEFAVSAKNITGDDVKEFTYSKLTSWNDWKQDGDTWTATVPFMKDAHYTVDFAYTDIAGNAAEQEYNELFTVDTTEAYDLKVIYTQDFVDVVLSKIFFYKPDMNVGITAKDDTSGIEYFSIKAKVNGLGEATDLDFPRDLVLNADGTVKSGTKGFIGDITSVVDGGKVSLYFDVPAQFRGEFIIESVTDLSHNVSGKYDDDTIVVVDTISPDVKVEFTGSLKDKIDTDVKGEEITRQTKDTTDANTRFVYDGDVTATITVKEANFYDDMVITVFRDGEVVTDSVISDWTQIDGTYEYVKTVKLSADGDYQIQLDYEDKADNKMDVDASGEYAENKADRVGTYTSNIHTIDTTIPTYTIKYDNYEVIRNIDGRDYYNANRTATITVTDRNFRPNETELTVAAKDITGEDVDAYSYSKLLSWSDWKQDGITWTVTVPFTTDANYTVNFSYTDIAGHKVENDYTELFTVDKVAPGELTVNYVKPTFVERIIEAVTFNFYNAPVTVEISATDDISGVYRFIYSYLKSEGVSDVNAELIDIAVAQAEITYSGNKATATFTLPKDVLTNVNQFRGNVAFTAFDICENNDETKDPITVVVDNIAPQVDVTYTAKTEDTVINYMDADLKNVKDFASATQAVYNGNVIANVTINEANFFEGKTSEDGSGVVHEVGLLLTKTDNNGVVTKTEYLPAGASMMFANEATDTAYIEWKHDKDVHSFEIEYDLNADYVLTVKYVDFSENESVIEANDGQATVRIYDSKIITVDKIDPVIDVEYKNLDVKNTVDGREYFDKEQVAVITITEHNFRADDVNVDVIAKDVIGGDVAVADFDALLRNRNSWKHFDENGNEVVNAADGNIHVATIEYSVDANYTFDIDYTDIANHRSAKYEKDLFTVDKAAPTKLAVTYSDPKLWDKILESITFGFYNAKMEVTVYANDATAGIHHFKYSYIKSKGVSDVNADLIDQAITAASIESKGATFSATFSIPKSVLNNNNQFNGTVAFTAYDRSENNTDMADDKRIVVDSIKPTSQVTFSNPVQNANNISYYAGSIDATIVINEANFYSKDVNVSITKDGANYPVNIKWVDNSVDVHTGTFTLTEDGDYIVTVVYADRSTNQMDTYTSNRLTIDTKTPVINVSNIKNNSANKDEVYTFTITADDTNIDISGITPVLRAILRDENGNYSVENISLGNARTVSAGKTYSYTVENLEEDALYTLTCSARDMSGNSYARIKLEDGNEYDTVNFSINRDGSSFGLDENTEKLVEKYYVYSVNNNVVIKEINVDPVENYTVKLNGKVLEEGKDYTTKLTSKSDEWSLRTYTLKKSLFENEGEYSVIVESVDKTETTAFSDVKNLKVSFVVDQTAPVITISGLEDGGRYQIDEQVVTVIPTDDGGKLNRFKAILLDAEGNELEVRFEMAGEELAKYLEENDGKITFTVPEGFESQIRIICNDCAVDGDDATNTYDYTFKKVTVSQSRWVIFYANKVAFYGSIAGVVLLIAGVIFLIVYKKNKKSK